MTGVVRAASDSTGAAAADLLHARTDSALGRHARALQRRHRTSGGMACAAPRAAPAAAAPGERAGTEHTPSSGALHMPAMIARLRWTMASHDRTARLGRMPSAEGRRRRRCHDRACLLAFDTSTEHLARGAARPRGACSPGNGRGRCSGLGARCCRRCRRCWQQARADAGRAGRHRLRPRPGRLHRAAHRLRRGAGPGAGRGAAGAADRQPADRGRGRARAAQPGAPAFDVGVAMDARMDEVYAGRYRWRRRRAGRCGRRRRCARLAALQPRPGPAAAAGAWPAPRWRRSARGWRCRRRPLRVDADIDRAAALLRLAQQRWRGGAGVDAARGAAAVPARQGGADHRRARGAARAAAATAREAPLRQPRPCALRADDACGDLDAVLAIERAAYSFPWTRGNFIDSLAAGYLAELLVDDRGRAGRLLRGHGRRRRDAPAEPDGGARRSSGAAMRAACSTRWCAAGREQRPGHAVARGAREQRARAQRSMPAAALPKSGCAAATTRPPGAARGRDRDEPGAGRAGVTAWPWTERQRAMLQEMGLRLWAPARRRDRAVAPTPQAAPQMRPRPAPGAAPAARRSRRAAHRRLPCRRRSAAPAIAATPGLAGAARGRGRLHAPAACARAAARRCSASATRRRTG